LIPKQLIDAGFSIMVTRIHSLPEREEDAVDQPFKLPYLLQQAGVPFCIQNEGDMEAMNARNLPFQAGTAMAYGLTEEQAVAAISLSACKILGIDKDYGSVEEGKSATLFVSTGSALDMRSNNVTLAMINGVFMSLDNSQKALYEKYEGKYR
jgi:imidazolonepropionase-like amidohydrolase